METYTEEPSRWKTLAEDIKVGDGELDQTPRVGGFSLNELSRILC